MYSYFNPCCVEHKCMVNVSNVNRDGNFRVLLPGMNHNQTILEWKPVVQILLLLKCDNQTFFALLKLKPVWKALIFFPQESL